MPSSAPAPFSWILLAQGLSAGSELFGQRVGRRVHGHSNLRLVVSMAVYCSLQAFIVLGIGEYALPTSFTGGQGSISMWKSVMVTNPELWLNAINNSAYWLALSFLLREPVGAILVVLAFLAASFLVDPFQQAVGLEAGAHIPPGSVVLGIIGALLCVGELPLATANAALARMQAALAPCVDRSPCCPRRCRSSGSGACAYAPIASLAGVSASGIDDDESSEKQLPFSPSWSASASASASSSTVSSTPASATASSVAASVPAATVAAGSGRRSFEDVPLIGGSSSSAGTGRIADDAVGGRRGANGGPSVAAVGASAPSALALQATSAPSGCCGRACAVLRGAGHGGAVLAAFAVLAITTATGITLTTWMQARAGLSAFGYTAVDQVLLPFTTLPLVALLERVLCLRRLVGEPRWSEERENSPSFFATMRRTWAEVKATPEQLCPEDDGAAAAGAAAAGASSSVVVLPGDACSAGVLAGASSALVLPGDTRSPRTSYGSADDASVATGVHARSAPAPLDILSPAGQTTAAASGPTAQRPCCGCGSRCAALMPKLLLRPWPMFFTLAAFHGLEFIRTFLFFILVTQYDTETTYVSMTLVRILLVAGASLLACTSVRRWVGISAAEAAGVLHPVNLLMRGTGACALVVSILLLKGLI